MIPSILGNPLIDATIWGGLIIAQYAFAMLGGYLHTLLVSLWRYCRLRRISGDIDGWLESLWSDRIWMYGALVIFLLLILILRQITVGIVDGTSNSWAWDWIWVFATPIWATGVFVAFEFGTGLAIKSLERRYSKRIDECENASRNRTSTRDDGG